MCGRGTLWLVGGGGQVGDQRGPEKAEAGGFKGSEPLSHSADITIDPSPSS
ncbi:conserved hypothetical protein [Kyrpidia tusciae DSM 2912]|uniref:Uncharacterized protein n=1 Tax=Kyrpidia tusciae (strain DSM 2912 / NBRC 15312 / T2) TaxID=562970 RepID=D5WSG4_KYRT2|nr:conserved hypothetical protein [Kyrpidia tusciae DSM 2912]